MLSPVLFNCNEDLILLGIHGLQHPAPFASSVFASSSSWRRQQPSPSNLRSSCTWRRPRHLKTDDILDIAGQVTAHLKLTSIGITTEGTGPLDESRTLLGTGSNSEQSDGAERRGVRESGSRRDDGEGDVVLEGAVLLLLDLLDGSVLFVMKDVLVPDSLPLHTEGNERTDLEGESVDIGLVGSSLDNLGALKSRPPFGERGELDQVPNVGQGLYDKVFSRLLALEVHFCQDCHYLQP